MADPAPDEAPPPPPPPPDPPPPPAPEAVESSEADAEAKMDADVAQEDEVIEDEKVAEAPSEVKEAEDTVAADKWNLEAWRTILSFADTLPIAGVRKHYERFLAVYPSAASWWQRYGGHMTHAPRSRINERMDWQVRSARDRPREL